jgi:hypothetical protein
MKKNTIAVNGTNRIDQLADNAVAVQEQLNQIGENVLLTEQDVERAKQNVALLVQQQDRLNRIYTELNQLPSGIKSLFEKTSPKQNQRGW